MSAETTSQRIRSFLSLCLSVCLSLRSPRFIQRNPAPTIEYPTVKMLFIIEHSAPTFFVSLPFYAHPLAPPPPFPIIIRFCSRTPLLWNLLPRFSFYFSSIIPFPLLCVSFYKKSIRTLRPCSSWLNCLNSSNSGPFLLDYSFRSERFFNYLRWLNIWSNRLDNLLEIEMHRPFNGICKNYDKWISIKKFR